MENSSIIIDNGSGVVKAGFTSEEEPSSIFPSLVGRVKYEGIPGCDSKDEFIGSDVLPKRGICNLTNPIEHGIVTDWDDMMKVWEHTFLELRHDYTKDKAKVHLTEAPMNPKYNREKMMEIFFENFQVPAFYVSIQAI